MAAAAPRPSARSLPPGPEPSIHGYPLPLYPPPSLAAVAPPLHTRSLQHDVAPAAVNAITFLESTALVSQFPAYYEHSADYCSDLRLSPSVCVYS
jgi:hypothetical protein